MPQTVAFAKTPWAAGPICFIAPHTYAEQERFHPEALNAAGRTAFHEARSCWFLSPLSMNYQTSSLSLGPKTQENSYIGDYGTEIRRRRAGILLVVWHGLMLALLSELARQVDRTCDWRGI
jgi:hypothetical protein